MTLNDLRGLDREYLLPREVAEVLGCDAQDIRCQAKADPSKLGFSVIIVGSRTKIPRRPFLKYMGVE